MFSWSAKKICIMHVTNNSDDAVILEKTLSDDYPERFDMLHVRNLTTALTEIAYKPFDIILLDLSLPDGCGLEPVTQIQAINPQIPVVVFTDTDDDKLAQAAVRAGAQDYLIKGRESGHALMRSIRYAIERKHAEQALLKSRKSLARAQRIAHLGSWNWDIDSDTHTWTKEMYQMLGVTPTDAKLTLDDFYQRIHFEDREAIEYFIDSALSHPDIDFDVEFRVPRGSNGDRVVHARGEVSRDDSGKPIKMFGTIQDVSEHKRLEAALQTNTERLKLALEGANEGLWDWSIDTGAVYYSPRWMTMLGYPNAAVNANIATFKTLLHVDDISNVQHSWQAHVDGHTRVFEAEFRLKSQSGLWVWVMSRGRVVSRNGNGMPLRAVGTHTDISEHKRVQTMIQTAKEAALQANQAKSEFLANMSHEIRTPMSAINGLTHLALNAELSDKVRKYLDKIAFSSQVLLGIINDILDFSKIEAGKMVLEAEVFRLDDLIAELINTHRPDANENGVELRAQTEPDIANTIKGDVLRLRQVLTNFIKNAIKFTNAGSIILNVTQAQAQRSNDQIKLIFSVKDTGIGIEPADVAKLFDPFTQADASGTRKYGGAGIGLAICKRLVEMMGGNIDVDSKPGKGATFQFTAMVEPVEIDTDKSQSPLLLKSSATDADLERIKDARVLLVDDNEINQMVAKQILEQIGLAVTLAAQGKDALAAVANSHFDIVLMDLLMPEMDGFEATRLIRNSFSKQDLPIIAMTASDTQSDLERSMQAGMNDRINKPFEIDNISSTLCKWIKKESLGKPDVSDVTETSTTSNVAEEAKVTEVVAQEADVRQKVLIVDDVPTNIMVLNEILQNDYRIFFSTSGQNALNLAIKESPDLILLDVMMPEMDGFEVCVQLKTNVATRDIPVIFVTAMGEVADEAHGLEVGAIDYITKPISPSIVKMRVKNHLEMKRQRNLLSDLSSRDGLTGIPNRRRFDEFFEQEWRRAERVGLPLSLIMMDIDFFKPFNDNYGHSAGDVCLKKVAHALLDCVKRPADLVARYGGEEFSCILPETDIIGASSVAKDLRDHIRKLQIPHDYSKVTNHVTISIGVATVIPPYPEHYTVLIEKADKQLYRAKMEGRDRIVFEDRPIKTVIAGVN